MSTDYKYDMQMRAEEIAAAEFGKDFYDLPGDKQTEIFQRAMVDWSERQMERADYLNDLAKESGV